MEIRRLNEDEKEQADLVWLQAFQRGERAGLQGLRAYRERFGHRIDRFGLWDGDELETVFEQVNTHLHFGKEAILPAVYISSIATTPACRGRGYARDGLLYLLGQMRDSGTLVTTLSPFRFDFYRRLGWEWISVSRTYKIPSTSLKMDPETAHVRRAAGQDSLRIRAAYAKFATRYRGTVCRGETQWGYLLDDRDDHFTYSYLYERDGEVEGYLVLRGGSGEETWIPEFITLTARAQRALLGLLKRHEMQTKQFMWKAPADDGLWSQGYSREISTTISPDYQGRIVDAAAALAAWKPDPDARGALTLQLSDEAAAWNDGAWRIQFEAGNVSVERCKEEPVIRMDIHALTQAFFGVLTVDELRRQDRLDAEREDSFESLRKLLAGPPMWTAGEY